MDGNATSLPGLLSFFIYKEGRKKGKKPWERGWEEMDT